MPKAAKNVNRCTYRTCPSTFTRLSELNQHVGTVDPLIKDFCCPICAPSKDFARKEGQNVHLRTHAKDDRCQCRVPGCISASTGFKDRTARLRHETEQHAPPGFECPEPGCSLVFKRCKTLKWHVEELHPGKWQTYTESQIKSKWTAKLFLVEILRPLIDEARNANSPEKRGYEDAPDKGKGRAKESGTNIDNDEFDDTGGEDYDEDPEDDYEDNPGQPQASGSSNTLRIRPTMPSAEPSTQKPRTLPEGSGHGLETDEEEEVEIVTGDTHIASTTPSTPGPISAPAISLPEPLKDVEMKPPTPPPSPVPPAPLWQPSRAYSQPDVLPQSFGLSGPL